jgi:hypothetical protein
MKNTRTELVNVLQNSLQALEIKIPSFDQQQIIQAVWTCMSQPNRVYHTPSHLTDVFLPDDPLANVALLFHDVVHCLVDRGFPPEVYPHFKREIVSHDQKWFLRAVPHEEDINLKIVREIFGLKSSDELNPELGMNEFLSALVAVRMLGPYMPLELRVRVAVCIEATIPFRPPNASGENSFDLVYKRLIALTQELQLELSNEDCVNAVKCGVRVANSDISNFTFADPSDFLDHTWRNIAEANPRLSITPDFTIAEYRSALLRMSHFFSSITADRVLSRFQDYPSKDAYELLLKLTETNLERAESYLKGKILSIAIIEAIADCSGGDETLNHFVGRRINGVPQGPQLEDFLPEVSVVHADSTPELLALFEWGRSGIQNFDIQRSPIAGFLCRRIGLKRMEKFASSAEQMWLKSISSREFLRRLDQSVVRDIIVAISNVAVRRKQELLKLIA